MLAATSIRPERMWRLTSDLLLAFFAEHLDGFSDPATDPGTDQPEVSSARRDRPRRRIDHPSGSRPPSPSTGLGGRSSARRDDAPARATMRTASIEAPLSMMPTARFRCRTQRHVIATAHRAHMSIASLVAHRPCAAAQGPMNGVVQRRPADRRAGTSAASTVG